MLERFQFTARFTALVMGALMMVVFGAVAHGEVFLDTNFEGSTSLPTGWTQTPIIGSLTWVVQTGGRTGGANPTTAHGGTNNATLYSTNTADEETQLISPVFDTDGHSNITLSFWHIQNVWAGDQDELKVLFSSDGGTTWDQLAQYTDHVADWTQRTLVLPTASANSRIAFQGNAKYGHGVCLDDITVQDGAGYGLNILVVGSTHSFSEGGEHDVVHEKPFNPTAIAAHLEEILDQDTAITETVNVVFEDVFKKETHEVRTSKYGYNDITAHCYSLAQHFMWPDGKTTRLANLRSDAGTKWDYIVLCADPYIMANFPGMYAEGVKLIQSEVAKTVVPQGETAPEVILMAQWPENSSSFSATDFNEVVQRVGSSAGLTVVPAGKVWDALDTSQDADAAHPTPKGEYLAAASIYSKLYARSASSSAYSFSPGGDAMADLALTEVQAVAATSQYSGTYTAINPYQMKYFSKRSVSFRETGTSTEDRLREALGRADDAYRITLTTTGEPTGQPAPLNTYWDFNYGRGNDDWEDDKDYEVNSAKHGRAYGFPIHHYYTGTAANAAAQTMPYGIDKYFFGSSYNDGTDLGIAYNMIRPNTRELSLPEDVRAIPIRLLWLKMEQASPGFNPLGDNTHMSPYLNDASAAFMYTLLSGRCPVVEEPATVGSAAWMQWLGHKVGYETAWQMSHLTTRAPGFRVLPSHVDATTVTTTASETMTVRFMSPPQSDVTVSISSSDPGVATVSPSTLTFTSLNYDTPQEITVSGVAADAGLQNFNVLVTTTSSDEIYDGLSDSWAYASNTDSVSYGQTVLLAGFDGTNAANTTSGTAGVYKEITAPHKSSTSSANVNASLTTTDAVVGGFQWAGMTSPTTWGSAVYTPNASTTTNLVFAADNSITCSLVIENTGSNEVTLEKLHFRLQRDNAAGGSANQLTITLASGDLTASGSGVQALSSSSGANNYDFDLSSMLTDATLAAGESATFSLSFVPTDPTGTNRRIRVDNLAIAGMVTEVVPSDYSTWAQLHSVTGQPGDDDDFDGMSNDFERLFGLDPKNASSANPMVVPLNPTTGTFSYTRRTQSLTGKVYKVWSSTNLSGWTWETSAVQNAGTPVDGVETVAVTLDSELLTNTKLFIKISAEDP